MLGNNHETTGANVENAIMGKAPSEYLLCWLEIRPIKCEFRNTKKKTSENLFGVSLPKIPLLLTKRKVVCSY